MLPVPKILLINLLLSLSAILLWSCSPKVIPTANMGYVAPRNLPNGKEPINPIRMRALRDTATSLGARGALAFRTEQINTSLQKNAGQLDRIFDFNQLILHDNVIPPVLVESENNFNLADPDSIRLATKTYKIVLQARFATTPPNWRNYLWADYKKPDMPDFSLLPKNQAEATIWNVYLAEGWKQGIQQANAIFGENLNRLKRDYNGMLLYRKLLAQNMVSPPFVAKAELGVTGDTQEIRINDQILRITAHPELQPNSGQWTPILTK